MIVITVARRPLAGTVAVNVLQHGTGALNIDACRVGVTSDDGIFAKNPHTEGGFGHAGAVIYGKSEGAPPGYNPSVGRWPANLILGHKPGCQRLDTTATSAAPRWECELECLTAKLDADVGVLRGRGNVNPTRHSSSRHIYGQFDDDHVGEGYASDAGGPSKFFKQVSGGDGVPPDLLEYLCTLITPTHVGGESLITFDLDGTDFAAIPDSQYHGAVVRGEPSEEQVKHLWRVTRPGAHVLLIAPDHRPTGHVGACALEDGGFEIRDAILWATDPTKIHYVPKANTKERNFGCETLAAKRRSPPTYELTQAAREDIASLAQDLLDAGLDEDLIDNIGENGIPKDKIPKGFRSKFKEKEGGGRYGNSHPTVKPVEIMRRLLRDVPEDAVVVDPFLGSGTTALACIDTGHSVIGIERDPEYVEIADARIRAWAASKLRSHQVEIDSDVTPQEGGPPPNGLLFELFDE